MLYPLMTLPDHTEIVHSESIFEDGKEKVRAVIEQPIDYGFKSAVCWLPEYRREKADGFSANEIDRLQKLLAKENAKQF